MALYVNAYGSNFQKRKLSEDVTWWFIDKQLSRYKNLDIQIDLVKIDDVNGSCVYHENNTFEIEIDKRLDGDDFVSCILHELIHVEQHLKKMHGIDGIDQDIPYLEKPYEKDAYKRSEVLLKEYYK